MPSSPVPSSPATPTSPATAGSLQVSGVGKSFDGVTPVLSGIDLVANSGETVALLGPSGCGKTTLLRIIAGLESADTGQVILGDRCVSGPGVMIAPEQRQIGMVFQDWALFPHLSVARNVGFGLPRGERKESSRIDEALALVGLTGFGDRSPSTLSGGQRQRLAIARALYKDAPVLILDEATSALDNESERLVQDALQSLQKNRTTLVIAHRLTTIQNADRIVVMEQGRIVEQGTHQQLLQAQGAYAAMFKLSQSGVLS